jgi:1-acyl-sn-glycerol-3-phosphate acyltransferase
MLVIAPEGTRSKVHRFKTGFLHIARGAGVPVALVALDWGTRTIRIGPVVEVGEDVEAERVRVEAYFAQFRGRNR